MGYIIATDLTDASVDAAIYTVRRARQLDTPVTVLNVVGSADIDTRDAIAFRFQMRRDEPDARSVVDEFEQAKITEVETWFTDAVGDVSGLDVSFAIEFGDLPEVVWRVVDEVGAAILVVGAHGRTSIGRHLSRILLDATIPVVVVREGILR